MLKEALREAKRIAIVGLEKNTGKTTVLNHLIEVNGGERTLFLTSIGYDGESVDQVTKTHKPRIFVPKGTLIATARSLLPRCTVEKEILDTTSLATAMGEVILFRALDAGYVELAGPSTIAQMKQLVDKVSEEYSVLPIIDGALSRLSSAGHGLAEEIILCTGPSVHPSFQRVMDKTLLTAALLNFPKAHRPVDFSKAAAYLMGEEEMAFTATDDGEGLLQAKDILKVWQDEPILALKGLLSEAMVLDFLKWKDFRDKTIILEDATRLFVTPATFETLKRRQIRFEVTNPVKLLCIAINPTSPRGRLFDEMKAKQVLKASGVPVINVRRNSDELKC